MGLFAFFFLFILILFLPKLLYLKKINHTILPSKTYITLFIRSTLKFLAHYKMSLWFDSHFSTPHYLSQRQPLNIHYMSGIVDVEDSRDSYS